MLSKLARTAAALFIAAVLSVTAFAGEDDEAAPAARELKLPCVELSLYTNAKNHRAYIHGYGDGTFRPGADISRAEAA